jgi:MFS family permease
MTQDETKQPGKARDATRRFAAVSTAGITFQAGSAAVDSATIMSALVHQLTGSPIAVGAVTAILRFGWLFPQLFVGFLAQNRQSSMPYYIVGAFGRASCLAVLALVLLFGSVLPAATLAGLVLGVWTAYAFVSGIVAVPYNDIVARSVPSERRSRLLAFRFFGGGVLALGVAIIADRFVGNYAFPMSYAAIIAMASALMFLSSIVFVAVGEPEQKATLKPQVTFYEYLREGAGVFRRNDKFRMFVFAQWCGGAVLMAMPFFVVQASVAGFDLVHIAWLLAAQTTGALLSNPLWGWWGDRRGKGSLYRAIAVGRILPPLVVLTLIATQHIPVDWLLPIYLSLFFVLGALANGLTIAVIGFLMEISPDDQRPAYSGYFNALTAPAFLLPLVGGVIASFASLSVLFVISLAAAAVQALIVHRIMRGNAVSKMT